MMLFRQELFTIWMLKDIAMEGKEQNLLAKVYCNNCLGLQEELVIKIVRELYHLSARSVCFAKWSKNNSLFFFVAKSIFSLS